MISRNFGRTWTDTKTNPRLIVVIAPGAGTVYNNRAYKRLARTYEIKIIDAKSRSAGFDYPGGWRDNKSLDLKSSDRKGLLGLANTVGTYLINHPPAVVICGSRGSQVTIGLVWKHYWRGPTICINAGPLTSHTIIPKGVYPILVTMENDYFDTQERTQDKFAPLSQVDGKNVYRFDDGHMPNLSRPSNFLLNVVDLALKKHSMPSSTDYKVTTLHGVVPRTKTKKRKRPPTPTYTVHSRHKATWLREHNSSERKNFTAKVKNGTKLVVLDHDVDEKGYEMVLVTTPDHKTMGWIYAMNIKELS
uniref:Uncharacterized protein n=1 Tax=viral metagenome TaxID=1070528 RepID=A0A6C0BQG7_9ZZZZ